MNRRPTPAEAAARIDRVNEVLTPTERALMEGVCGRGDMLEDVAARLFLPVDEALAILRTALDKTQLVFAFDKVGGSVQ